MLNSKNRAIVKIFGDKIEFNIARFHCTSKASFWKGESRGFDENVASQLDSYSLVKLEALLQFPIPSFINFLSGNLAKFGNQKVGRLSNSMLSKKWIKFDHMYQSKH